MKKLSTLILVVLFMTLVADAGVAMAADKIGFVDEAYVLSQSDKYKKAQQDMDKLSRTKSAAAKIAADKEKDEKKKAQIAQQMVFELREAEQKMVTPIITEINGIIAKVAKGKNITIILGRSLVFYGGIDITEDVVKEMKRM